MLRVEIGNVGLACVERLANRQSFLICLRQLMRLGVLTEVLEWVH